LRASFSPKFSRLACRVILIGCSTSGLLASHALFAAQLQSLKSAKPDGTPIQVTAKLEVGGLLEMVADGDSDKESASSADKTNDKSTAAPAKNTQTVPMSVVGQFSYDEQRLDDGNGAAHRLSVRYYDDAQAVIKIANKITKPQLRDNRKLITVVATKDAAYLSAPDGPLTRDELELIDIPANTLVLDQLLPESDVEIGHRWKPSADALARFLCLDAVGHTEVDCLLTNVKDNVAEISINGTLGGAIDGVATDIELKAKLLFDIELQLPKTLLLAIKEQRGIGHVTPGLDIVAKLRLNIAPRTDSKLLTADAVQSAKLPQSDTPPPLEYVASVNGFRFTYDRRWHLTRDDSDLLVMRLIDRGDLVAQCNISPSPIDAKKPLPLTEFQTDVQQALGKMFGKFDRATESTSSAGTRILLSVADGTAAELPIQWRYYLLHDEQGHGVTVVFTMEQPLVDQFRDQDMPIVNSVEFIDTKVASRQ
jgi:hypothetical protein